MYKDVHFPSGATSHTKAKMFGAVVDVDAGTYTDDAALRVIEPATAAYHAEITESSTLRVNYKSAGCISSIIYCRIIIIPIKTPFLYIPAHIV